MQLNGGDALCLSDCILSYQFSRSISVCLHKCARVFHDVTRLKARILAKNFICLVICIEADACDLRVLLATVYFPGCSMCTHRHTSLIVWLHLQRQLHLNIGYSSAIRSQSPFLSFSHALSLRFVFELSVRKNTILWQINLSIQQKLSSHILWAWVSDVCTCVYLCMYVVRWRLCREQDRQTSKNHVLLLLLQ